MITVQTERLSLRQWCSEDKPIFARMNANSQVMEYFPNTLSRAQSDALVDRFYGEIDLLGWGFWAAELSLTKEFIGFIGMNYSADGLPFAPCVDIGWRLAPQCWGMGYATEGAQGVIKYAFGQAGLTRLVSMTPVSNARSERVMIKLGMIKRAENFLHPKVADDSPLQEHVLYAISKDQWFAE